jgi:hypothetical protein
MSRKRAATLLQEHSDWVLQQLEFMQQQGAPGTRMALPKILFFCEANQMIYAELLTAEH